MVARVGRYNQVNEYASQSLEWDKNNSRPVCPDSRFTQNFRAVGFHFCVGYMNICNFKTTMMLSALRVLFQKLGNRAILTQGLDQFDLTVGRINEAHPYALGR